MPIQHNRYCCVPFDGNICVFHTFIVKGYEENNPLRLIWLYNPYTERWRKYKIPCGQIAPSSRRKSCAVAIGAEIYIFGGMVFELKDYTNELWKLTRTATGCFRWSVIEFQQDAKLPSPRTEHSGFEYAECLWVYGGCGGYSMAGYLNDHGDIRRGFTNQLLCYNPRTQTWTNPQCFGDVPSPRTDPGTAIMKDKAWIYGGHCTRDGNLDDFFELNLLSRTWNEIQTEQITPRYLPCFSAISDRQLLLHGGCNLSTLRDTWIMDLSSHTWKKLPVKVKINRNPEMYDPHWSCCRGVNKSVVIFGDLTRNKDPNQRNISTFHVMLEPRSLQQLAMKLIYNLRDVIPWQRLPRKLISQLGLSECEKSSKHESDS